MSSPFIGELFTLFHPGRYSKGYVVISSMACLPQKAKVTLFPMEQNLPIVKVHSG
jgi:hypothetical protein